MLQGRSESQALTILCFLPFPCGISPPTWLGCRYIYTVAHGRQKVGLQGSLLSLLNLTQLAASSFSYITLLLQTESQGVHWMAELLERPLSQLNLYCHGIEEGKVCVCVCVCMDMCEHVCVGQSYMFFLWHHQPLFKQRLSLAWSLPSRVGCLDRKPQRCLVPYSQF